MLKPYAAWQLDAAFALATAALIATVVGIDFLNSANWPTGSDSGSHSLYAWLYSEELLFSGNILPWIPEVFCGLPFLSYYFPLPFIVIAVLAKLIGFVPAFKWGSFLAAMMLPGAVFSGGRRLLGLPLIPAFFGALGSLTFILHEHEKTAIWGGNLLSLTTGEFAYSYGLLFAVLAMMAWARAATIGRGWILAGLLEAACGFSHGFPLLVVGFSTVFLLFESNDGQRFRCLFMLLARGHLLAFCLLGGWLWPMLEMHGLTIPNDATFPQATWDDLLPTTLWPVAIAGIAGLAGLALPAVRGSWPKQQALAARYFTSTAGLAALGYIAGNEIGLADIRFFPMVWLFGCIVCGWLFGQALSVLGPTPGSPGQGLLRFARIMLVASCSLALIGWLGERTELAPIWSRWDLSGMEAKPQWHQLKQLFPAMQGDLWSPRLLFEADERNIDLGSTRTLEALPIFLHHRPVLEGLYAESAILGPAIYQVQSEVSASPYSALQRFPGGSLDPEFAASHMNFLHADSLLLRSEKAKETIENSGLFDRIAEAAPFSLYRLKQFDSHLAEVVTKPLSIRPQNNWLQDAYVWFSTRSRFNRDLPVYSDDSQLSRTVAAASSTAAVHQKLLSRHELVFETEAVGSPHLIKLAYHPRWHLATKGSLHIAAPGFMLVIPEEPEIRLVYGHTLVGKLGMAATVLSFVYLTLLALRRRQSAAASSASNSASLTAAAHGFHWTPILTGWILLLATGTFFAIRSPERVYNQAWTLVRAEQYLAATEYFQTAYEWRGPPAKKEEALFWLSKSREWAGLRVEAKAGYRELCEHYHGYWLPESLYTLAILEQQDGQNESATRYVQRLREEFPANSWTLKLDSKE